MAALTASTSFLVSAPASSSVAPPRDTCSLRLPPQQILGSKLVTSTPLSVTSRPRTPLTVCKVSKGDVVPSFTLKDQDGKPVSLSKFKGKPVVLYFYPADETPGCTKQACAFRDSYEKFKKAGAEVIGISGDSSESHKNFARKYRLPFTLLSDEGNKLRKEWGIPGDFFGSLPGRQTYVIDRKGVVQLIFNNQFQPENDQGNIRRGCCFFGRFDGQNKIDWQMQGGNHVPMYYLLERTTMHSPHVMEFLRKWLQKILKMRPQTAKASLQSHKACHWSSHY